MGLMTAVAFEVAEAAARPFAVAVEVTTVAQLVVVAPSQQLAAADRQLSWVSLLLHLWSA